MQSDSAAPLFWSGLHFPVAPAITGPAAPLCPPEAQLLLSGPAGVGSIRLLGQEVGRGRDCPSIRGGDGIFPQLISAGREWAEDWLVGHPDVGFRALGVTLGARSWLVVIQCETVIRCACARRVCDRGCE